MTRAFSFPARRGREHAGNRWRRDGSAASIVAIMVQVVLVAEAWSKVVDVESADDVIDAEGMSWERDGAHRGNPVAGARPTDVPADVPRYVPSVGA